MNRSSFLQPDDWDYLRNLLMEAANRAPMNPYRTAVIDRFTRTRDVCQPVFEVRPPRKRRKARKAP